MTNFSVAPTDIQAIEYHHATPGDDGQTHYRYPLVATRPPASVTEPIDYQGIEYGRSDVEYVHQPLSEVVARGLVPQTIQELVEQLPAGAVLAGGAVASLMSGVGLRNAADIDIFFTDQLAYAGARAVLVARGFKPMVGPQVPSGVEQFANPRWTHNIQLINIAFYPEGAEHVIDGFDFTCTHFAIHKGEVVFNPVAPTDYAARLLVAHRMEKGNPFKKRLAKYVLKGFRPVGPALDYAKELGLVMP